MINRLLSAFLLLSIFLTQSHAQSPSAAGQNPPPNGRRIALVIGNDAYRQKPLSNAVNDAKAMQAGLASAGYAVTLVADADLSKLKSAIDAFGSSLQPGDIALVFYAGHGFQIDGENYFVPVDFQANDPFSAQKAAVPMSSVTSFYRAQKVHAGILIADACRDNPFVGSRSSLPGLAAMAAGSGTLVALATFPGGTASDNPTGNHGLFTQALLDNLQVPGLSIDQIFSRVQDEVAQKSSNQQVPWVGSALRGLAPFAAAVRPTPGQIGSPMQSPGTPRGLANGAGSIPGINSGQPVQSAAVGGETGWPPDGFKTISVPGISRAVPQRSADDSSEDDWQQQFLEAIRSEKLDIAQQILHSVSSDPPPTGYNVSAAKLSLLKGNYPDALRYANAAIQEAPLDPLPLYVRAIAESLQGNYNTALTDIAARLKLQPDDPFFSVLKANILFVTGDYKNSTAILDQVISANPAFGAAYVVRGNDARAIGDTQGATADFRMATKLQKAN